MNEQAFDPQDTNKDGKVSLTEKIMHAADKANEAIGEAVDKVKAYTALSPEEKKIKQEEWNEKLTKAGEKASDSVKDIVEDIKEGAEKLFKGKKD